MSGAAVVEMPARRVCEVCGASARAVARTPLAGEPRILAISCTMHFKGEGKSQLQPVRAVRVCQECLHKALEGGLFGAGAAGSKLWRALRSRIGLTYGALVQGGE